MDKELANRVWERSGGICESCRLPQAASRLRFHVEHIVSPQHGGLTELENLAIACPRCNLHKGPNLAGIDPETGEKVWLFHPRRDQWASHFSWDGPVIVGNTPVGRATVATLQMNSAEVIEVRRGLLEEVLLG